MGDRRTIVKRVSTLAILYLNIMMIGLSHGTLQDFKGDLFDAGRAILQGHDPYRVAFIAQRAAEIRAGIVGPRQFDFSVPIYPAPILLAETPLSLLPYSVAATVFTILSASAVAVAVRLLGVRDHRCIAVAVLSWPTIYAFKMGAIGPLLLLGVAALWRWRDRTWPAAVAVATIVVAKLFPWPLALWMLVTRRRRALVLAVGLGAAMVLVAWWVIGFASLARYPGMLANLAYVEENRGVSLIGLLLAAGAPATTARALALGGVAPLLACAWGARRRGGQREAFGLGVMAALVASPIVWEHYMVLLFVPIALMAESFSTLWLLPMGSALIQVWIAPMAPSRVGGPLTWALIEAVIILRLVKGSRGGEGVDEIVPSMPVGTSLPREYQAPCGAS
jgi:hypothetical protein